MLKKPLTLKLDRARRFKWTNASLYRLSLIPLQPQKTFGFVVQTLWACLVPDDARDFETPEHFAEQLPQERMSEYLELYAKLIEQGQEAANIRRTEPKKEGGSTD